MNIKFLFILLLLIPFVSATVLKTGSYYSGESFNYSNKTFNIYGGEPVKVLLNGDSMIYYKEVFVRSDIESVNLRNGTCYSTNNYKYCYKDVVIDKNNPKTYQGDFMQPVMTVTLEALDQTTSIAVITRTKNLVGYCGKSITIPLSIQNTGTQSTTISYSETLPVNVVVTSTEGGNVNSNIITFRDIFGPGMAKNYTYTINNLDCKSKFWSGVYTYNNNNQTITTNVTGLLLNVTASYFVNENLSEHLTNNLGETIKYTWSINNTNPTSILTVNIIFSASNFRVLSFDDKLQKTTSTYNYATLVPAGQNRDITIMLKTIDYGLYNVVANGTISIESKDFEYNSVQELYAKKAQVTASIDADPNKTNNNTLYLILKLTNDDLIKTYYNIYGTFTGLEDESLIYSNITPNTKTIILARYYNLSNIGNGTVFKFNGVYRDKEGLEKSLSAEKLVNTNYIINITTPKVLNTNVTSNKSITQTSVTNTTSSASSNTTKIKVPSENKDFISSILEGISDFLSSLFG
jgi:hypothetical protein